MARTAPTEYLVIPNSALAQNRPIREGSDGGTHYGELDIAENCNERHCNTVPQVVDTSFVNGGYIEALTTSYVLRALWIRRPFVDLSRWEVSALASHSGANASNIKVEMASDSANIEISVSGTVTAWTEQTGTVTYDAAQTVDTIELWVKKGTSSTLRVHAMEIRPLALTTISAGISTAGFIPFDTSEFAADEPMPTAYRQWMHDNLEVIRKTRMDTIVGWSEDFARAAASAFETTSSTYVLVAEIPFRSTHGQTSVEWGLAGYLDAGGAGTVKLEIGENDVEVTLGTTWTSPYTAAQYDFDADGGAITCIENQPQYLNVYLKGNGVNKAYLMSLTAWFADIA